MVPPTVMLWQAGGGMPAHDLAFMYRPLTETLAAGFADAPPAVVAALGGPPRVLRGQGVRALMARRWKGDPRGAAAQLGAGDVFVWLGPTGSEVPAWAAMRRAGVRTVYYQTEPADRCALARSRPDEVWDFAWHNLDACRPRLPPGIVLRYVPLGFVPPPPPATPVQTAAPREGAEAELLFFGYPHFKSGRRWCYERLGKRLGARLNATWSVWSAEGFEAWWAARGQWSVHLNLHKSCESAHNPVVFRAALLLSRGAAVLSERAYPKDEEEFRGLVHFGAVDALPAMLDGLLHRSDAPALPRRSDGRALQTRREVAALFAERFAPRRIFERAGLYRELLAARNRSAAAAGTADAADAAAGVTSYGDAQRRARFALLLHGRLGTLSVPPSFSLVSPRVRPHNFIEAAAVCAASLRAHVLEANRGGVDVFVHSWNPDVGARVDALYAPHLRRSQHQRVQFGDKQKARSQALSVGRAALLMRAYERERGAEYALCLVLRIDLVVGAPILLDSFEPSELTFAEHCCMNDAGAESAQALVRAECGNVTSMRKRLLGPCRVSQYGGKWGLQARREDFFYFLMDWWFAGRPEVVASWIRISERWEWYEGVLRRMAIARWFSHYVWPIHVHDAMNLTASVRFRAGVRVNLVRTSFVRLRWVPGHMRPLGEFISDAIGNCDTLVTPHNATVNATDLLRTPVAARSALGLQFAGYAPMAEQCAIARRPGPPVVCCGEPGRKCGAHVCDHTHAASYRRFANAAADAGLAKARLPGARPRAAMAAARRASRRGAGNL